MSSAPLGTIHPFHPPGGVGQCMNHFCGKCWEDAPGNVPGSIVHFFGVGYLLLCPQCAMSALSVILGASVQGSAFNIQ